MYGIIYRAFLEDGRSYVGQTINTFEDRKNKHKLLAENSRNDCRHFYRAMRKYGFDSFMWEILDSAESKEELDLKEIQYIEKLNSIKNGFNIRTGGSRGKLSEESKEAISIKNSGEGNGMYGKLAWNSGRKLSQEHVDKIITKFKKGNIPWNKGKKNEYKTKPCSEEIKEKISQANSGSSNGRAKLNWDKINKIRELAKNKMKLKDIAKIYNVSRGHISMIVNNKQWKE